MKSFRKPVADVITGGALSVMFGGFLVSQIMSGGVGSSIDFAEFLTTPANLLFSVFMSVLILAAWLMKGTNNRGVLLSWALVIVLHSAIFYSVYDYYLYDSKNIYALCVAELIASVPVVLLVRNRIILTMLGCKLIWKTGLFRHSIGGYMSKLRPTDFEFDMKIALYAAFVFGFLYSLYMSSYGVFNQIPFNAGITDHMIENRNWSPTNLYYSLLDLVTFGYIIIVCLHINRDRKVPDSFAYGLSENERKQRSRRVLNKYRENANKKRNSKR